MKYNDNENPYSTNATGILNPSLRGAWREGYERALRDVGAEIPESTYELRRLAHHVLLLKDETVIYQCETLHGAKGRKRIIRIRGKDVRGLKKCQR